MVCKKCKAELMDNAVYCHICGKKQVHQPRRPLHRNRYQGTVTKLPRKGKTVYWARLPVEDIDGKQVRKSLGCFPSYKEASEAIALGLQNKEIAKVQEHIITLQNIYDHFLQGNYYAGLSKSAQGAHRTAWTHLSSISQSPVDCITKDTFQLPVNTLLAAGKKRETLAKVRNLCSLLCQEAMGMGLMSTNYGQLVQLPRKDSEGAIPFDSRELSLLWQQVDQGNAAAMAVQIMNYTGMRPGELLSLDIETHLHIHHGQYYFRTGSKTHAGRNRIIPVPPILTDVIDTLMTSRTSGPLIIAPAGGYYRLDNWRPRCFNRLMEELHLTGHTPYSCRHTYADLQKRRNINPEIMMEIMGHEDYSTTVEIYQTTTDEDLDRLFQAVSDMTRPK